MATSNDFLSSLNNTNIVNKTFVKTGKLPNKDNTLNQINDVTDLISEVYRVLGRGDKMKDKIAYILFSQLSKLEIKIKQLLSNNLNSCVSCSLNQVIPDQLIDTGINIELKNLDYKKVLKNNPSSEIGQTLYYDVDNGLNSNDLNVVLWNIINTQPTEQNWRGVLNISFIPFDTINKKTNVFKFRLNEKFRGAQLKDFNKQLIDNLDIYDEKTLVTNLFDSGFGTVTKQNKTQNELIIEQEFDDMVETIINSDDDFSENDSGLYSFSNDGLNDKIKQTTKLKFNLLNTSGDRINNKSTSEDTITFIKNVESATNAEDKSKLFGEYVDKLQTPFETDFKNEKSNKTTKIKYNVIKTIIRKLLLVISNVMISPKILMVLYINQYLTFGETEFNSNNNIKKVISGFKDTVYSTIKGIAQEIINYFIKDLQKLIIDDIVTPTIKRKLPEKIKLRKNQLLSLLGIDLDKLSASVPKIGSFSDTNIGTSSGAGSGSSVSQQAIDTANSALSAANQANSTANTALNTASTAQNTANNAQTDIDTVINGGYVKEVTLSGTTLYIEYNDSSIDSITLPSGGQVYADQITITGTGSLLDPFVAIQQDVDLSAILDEITVITGDIQTIQNEYIKDIYSTGSTLFVKYENNEISGFTFGSSGDNYQRLYDPYTDIIKYTGFSIVGSLTSDPVWTINKIITNINGDSLKTTFLDAVWDDRYSL